MPRALNITGAAMSPVPDGDAEDAGDVGFVTTGAGAGGGGAARCDRATPGVGATIPAGGRYAAGGVLPGVTDDAARAVAAPADE
jgi:hypothetical protein